MIAGLVNAAARLDEDKVRDEGSNASSSSDPFVIRVLEDREGDRVEGWEDPAPLPLDDDKMEFAPSTGVSVRGELTRALRGG